MAQIPTSNITMRAIFNEINGTNHANGTAITDCKMSEFRADSIAYTGGGGSSAANRNTTAGGSAGQYSGGYKEKPGQQGNTGIKGNDVDGGQPGYQNEHFFTAATSFFEASNNRGRGANGRNNGHNEGAWYDGYDGYAGMVVILEYK